MGRQLRIASMAGLLALLVGAAGPVAAAAPPVAPDLAFPKWCFGLGGSKTYSIDLPSKTQIYRFRVVPDRSGFNVLMRFNFAPNLKFTWNQFGPGRTETVFVRRGNNNRVGKVTVAGVGGSFGCFRLTVTP